MHWLLRLAGDMHIMLDVHSVLRRQNAKLDIPHIYLQHKGDTRMPTSTTTIPFFCGLEGLELCQKL